MTNETEVTANERATIAAKHLIGNLWFNLNAVPLIAGRLNPTVMQKSVNGPAAIAYGEMCRMLRTGEGLNVGQLEANLRDAGFDFSWIQRAQSDIANDSLYDLYNYVGEIQNASDLHDLKAQCLNSLNKSSEPAAKADIVKAELLSSLTSRSSPSSGPRHISEVSKEVREDYRKMRAGEEEMGASTGLHTLDRVFRLVDGEYITIGARSSQGKTSLAAWIAFKRALELKNKGENGQVLVFSMDDTEKKFLRALACTVAQVDSTRLKSKKATEKATEEEWEKNNDAMDFIDTLPLYIDDESGLTVDDIHYRTAMQNTRMPVRLIVADYIEKIKVSGFKDNDLGRLRYVASACKDMGHSFKCPFIMLSQITKEVESRADKWVTSSDLKYAGEEESDVIVLLHRPEHYISKGQSIDCRPEDEKGIVLVNIAKNKEGNIGLVRLGFKKEFTRFADLDMQRVGLNDY